MRQRAETEEDIKPDDAMTVAQAFPDRIAAEESEHSATDAEIRQVECDAGGDEDAEQLPSAVPSEHRQDRARQELGERYNSANPITRSRSECDRPCSLIDQQFR